MFFTELSYVEIVYSSAPDSTDISFSFTASTTPAGTNDVELNLKYYDFSKTHTDFNDVAYMTISNPTYVASPYGAWMSISNNPTTDTFSTWYRYDSSVNHEINSSIILRHQSGTIKRCHSHSVLDLLIFK